MGEGEGVRLEGVSEEGSLRTFGWDHCMPRHAQYSDIIDVKLEVIFEILVHYLEKKPFE